MTGHLQSSNSVAAASAGRGRKSNAAASSRSADVSRDTNKQVDTRRIRRESRRRLVGLRMKRSRCRLTESFVVRQVKRRQRRRSV